MVVNYDGCLTTVHRLQRAIDKDRAEISDCIGEQILKEYQTGLRKAENMLREVESELRILRDEQALAGVE